uniref:Uncharacterized protein n=1 Tax=Medicago truncatula TaxID=3880 RepID=Q2HRQ3_MEDTR|nr:hypothetical protein MtrDRAFT_AC158464g4v2 [Medicago truncatula]
MSSMSGEHLLRVRRCTPSLRGGSAPASTPGTLFLAAPGGPVCSSVRPDVGKNCFLLVFQDGSVGKAQFSSLKPYVTSCCKMRPFQTNLFIQKHLTAKARVKHQSSKARFIILLFSLGFHDELLLICWKIFLHQIKLQLARSK